jgi:hypothetical protein
MSSLTQAQYGQDFLANILSVSQEVSPPDDCNRFALVDTNTFLQMDLRLQWLVQGLLIRNQPCIIGAPRKTMKTNLCVALAVSLATGRRYLGHFSLPQPCRVGLFSGESGAATIQETYLRICHSLFMENEEIREIPIFWSFSLPQLSNEVHLEQLSEMIVENGLEVVIIDPVYLSLMSTEKGVNMSSLFEVGPLLNNISRTILDAGATPILVHHTVKNRMNPGEPLELEDLAFAGFQEFARQWMLISRREKYDPETGEHRLWLNAGGSAGFGNLWAVDIGEGQVRPDFTGRRWQVSVRLASEERQAATSRKAQQRVDADAAAQRKDCQTILDFLAQRLEGETRNSIIEMTGLSKARVGRAISILLDHHKIEECQVEKNGGRGGLRRYDAYRLVLSSSGGHPEIDNGGGITDYSEHDSEDIFGSDNIDTDEDLDGVSDDDFTEDEDE